MEDILHHCFTFYGRLRKSRKWKIQYNTKKSKTYFERKILMYHFKDVYGCGRDIHKGH